MGYHFGDSANHLLFKEHASDFYEMMFHHIATIALYFCMIYGNGMTTGCYIAYLHDIADIFVALCKTFTSLNPTYDIYSVISFAGLLSSWAWTRLFVLPYCIYIIFARTYDPIVNLFYKINGVFLCALLVLHIFWYSLFMQILWLKLTKGKSEDLTN
jgi:hypothetical protein